MAGLINILIDFHVCLCGWQRILLTTQVKTTWSFINHSFCEFTNWMSFTAKITCGLKSLTLEDSEVIAARMPHVWKGSGIKLKLHLNSTIYKAVDCRHSYRTYFWSMKQILI